MAFLNAFLCISVYWSNINFLSCNIYFFRYIYTVVCSYEAENWTTYELTMQKLDITNTDEPFCARHFNLYIYEGFHILIQMLVLCITAIHKASSFNAIKYTSIVQSSGTLLAFCNNTNQF